MNSDGPNDHARIGTVPRSFLMAVVAALSAAPTVAFGYTPTDAIMHEWEKERPVSQTIRQFRKGLVSQSHPLTQQALIGPDPLFSRTPFIPWETEQLDCSLSVSEPWIPRLFAESSDRYTTD